MVMIDDNVNQPQRRHARGLVPEGGAMCICICKADSNNKCILSIERKRKNALGIGDRGREHALAYLL